MKKKIIPLIILIAILFQFFNNSNIGILEINGQRLSSGIKQNITITSPGTNEMWYVWSTHIITWDYENNSAGISIWTDTGHLIIHSTWKKGFYKWTITPDILPDGEYQKSIRIKVENMNDSSIFDMSESILISNISAEKFDLQEIQRNFTSSIVFTIYGDGAGRGDSFDLKNGDGIFYGECMRIAITGCLTIPINITIEAGTTFLCNYDGFQNMVAAETVNFTLEPNTYPNFDFNALCLNMDKNYPIGKRFTVGNIVTNDTRKIIEYIDKINATGLTGQCALWMITNNATMDQLLELRAEEHEVIWAQGYVETAGIDLNIDEENNNKPYFIKDPDVQFILIIITIILIFFSFIIIGMGKERIEKH
jgi:hypothetical protein